MSGYLVEDGRCDKSSKIYPLQPGKKIVPFAMLCDVKWYVFCIMLHVGKWWTCTNFPVYEIVRIFWMSGINKADVLMYAGKLKGE